jgi:acyl-CoA thioester hydrolase
MDGYRVTLEHEVLFRDLDALGHVNNVAFMAFMEDARLHYWKVLRKKNDLTGINFILAEITCRYLAVAYLGEILLIGIRARSLGKKSFLFEYRMEEKTGGRLITEGKSVQVMYDYEQRQSIPLDEELRNAVAALEQLTLNELAARQRG